MADHEKINAAMKAALFLADPQGKIKIPCGTAGEIGILFAELSRLAQLGFLIRAKRKTFYRPFTLTQRGGALKYVPSAHEKAVAI